MAAGGMLQVLRDLQRDGLNETLRRFNLEGLTGRPASDVFLGITEAVCRDGGSIDEGIARDAWLEMIAEMDTLGIDDLDGLTTEEIQTVFQSFITHAIEALLFQTIGIRGFEKAASLDAIEAFEAELRGYIRRGVRDSFASDLSRLAEMSDREIQGIVDDTYQNAWDLLEAWGDIEE